MEKTLPPVAVYGVVGDPPHKGHLKVAEAVHDMGYARVQWMVTPQNPFKRNSGTAFHHRMELSRLLVGRRTWLEVSDAEGWMNLLGEDNRTHTMLAHMVHLYPETPFTFVLGADNWLMFHEWGKYKEILDMAAILVVPRPGSLQLEKCQAAQVLAARKDKATTGPVTQGTWRILADFPGGTASARQIRDELAKGGAPRLLTPEQLAYIHAHNIYPSSKV